MKAASDDSLRIGIAGPLLGGHPGWVPSPAETLAARLRANGTVVHTASAIRRPLLRGADTAFRMAAWRGIVDLVVVLVFSGKSFAIADLASRLTGGWLRVPLILWLHGGALPRFSAQHPRWTAKVLGRADSLVAPSRYLVDNIAHNLPWSMIPNPLDLSAYEHRRRRQLAPRLLWMRTFHEIYQPQMALEVLAHLRESHRDVRLTMAGQDRGGLAPLRARAEALGLTEAVVFPGFLDPEAKSRAFAEHDVFLNTNKVDNAPVTVIEAMASGLPVVSTDAGGLKYLIEHNRTGLLVTPGDAGAMAAAVRRLLDDPSCAEALSVAGRAMAERSDLPVVEATWRHLMAELLP